MFFIDVPSILYLLNPGNVTELFLTFFPFLFSRLCVLSNMVTRIESCWLLPLVYFNRAFHIFNFGFKIELRSPLRRRILRIMLLSHSQCTWKGSKLSNMQYRRALVFENIFSGSCQSILFLQELLI